MSVVAYFDGERVLITDGQRGCGTDYARQLVDEWLIANHQKIDARYGNGAPMHPLSQWCRDNDITLTTEIVEVKRERDLHK